MFCIPKGVPGCIMENHELVLVNDNGIKYLGYQIGNITAQPRISPGGVRTLGNGSTSIYLWQDLYAIS
jgi:hypothetical protein